ncbi:hypothetical protein ACI2OX_03690 [Bacillus sp. N9]
MHMAIQANNNDVAELLLTYNASVAVKDKDGKGMIEYLIDYEADKVLALFSNKGVLSDADVENAFTYAFEKKDSHFLERLLAQFLIRNITGTCNFPCYSRRRYPPTSNFKRSRSRSECGE